MAPISSPFADLIAPLAPSEIAALHADRSFKLQRRTGENRFEGFFDWNALWQLIENEKIPPADCRVTFGRRIVAPAFYVDADKINPGKLAKLLEQGVSLIVLRFERHLPAVSAVCRDAVAHGLPVGFAGAIVTTGAGGAFDVHYDRHDLTILQIEGSKRWRVFVPRVLRPVKEFGKAKPPNTAPALDTDLQAGDMLFLPGGYWHVCDNGPNRSLHFVLFAPVPKAKAISEKPELAPVAASHV
jgi:hypothetical protein